MNAYDAAQSFPPGTETGSLDFRSMSGRHLPWGGALFTVVVAVFALCTVPVATQSDDPFLRVSFIDVGQGDAIWIKGPIGAEARRGATSSSTAVPIAVIEIG